MIHAYLRASTTEQDATRANDTLQTFIDLRAPTQDVNWHVENHSGRDFNRPVLMNLINQADNNSIILIEQIDRLTRLTTGDWDKLKALLKQKNISIVSIDLPTTYAALKTSTDTTGITNVTKGITKAVNDMMLDILALMASKDYEDRRRRQAEGIAKNRKESPSKYEGKQQTQETINKCNLATKYNKENGLSQIEACKLANVSISTWRRFTK
jgi:DNA invertase Pin-like site-specific DNA recombinase